jgi:HK97 family phage prohead protease
MSNTREVRFLKATEVRAIGGSGDADPLRIEGYASVFNIPAQIGSGPNQFREVIRSGAFTRALSEGQDVVCLFNHNENMVLGRTTSGTLSLKQDQHGLWYSCQLPNTTTARDIHESIKRKDINGCSFAFTIPDGGQDWSEQRDPGGSYFIQRDITDLDLIDVSPVTHPAYGGTEVWARSIEVPVELRSAVDAKNAALVTPPADIKPNEERAMETPEVKTETPVVEERKEETPAPAVEPVVEERKEVTPAPGQPDADGDNDGDKIEVKSEMCAECNSAPCVCEDRKKQIDLDFDEGIEGEGDEDDEDRKRFEKLVDLSTTSELKIVNSIVREQPRKDNGKYGTHDGTKASSEQEHNSAAANHYEAAANSLREGNMEKCDAHLNAASAHRGAANAYKQAKASAIQATSDAQKASAACV